MASRSGQRVELLTAGLGRRRPVRRQSAPEVSDDAMLVNAAREGDRPAFGRLYDRYAHMVHGVLLAKAPVSEVDDLVQDVFLLALRRLSTLREARSFGAWLAAIARNLASDYHRRYMSEDPLEDDASGNDIEHGKISRDYQRPAAAILDAVKSLPDVYRETLRRRTWLFGVSLFLTLVPLSLDFTQGHIVSLTVRGNPWLAAFDWSLAAVLWFLYFARLRWRAASLVCAIFFTLIPIPFVLHSVLAGGRVLEFAIVWIWAALIWVGYFRQRVC
jgi:RNA polymerase sigma-70 factor (ECF subfamily)